MAIEHFDVLIIGAGLSGIGAGYHLQSKCPRHSYAILEAREAIGGTWDLFRYPGVRSDSDMHTLGYIFKPWRGAKAIADGPAILSYIRETAAEYGIDRKIRFNHRVTSLSWSSAAALWTVAVERGPERQHAVFTCGFVLACSGYYDYAAGYLPNFPGVEQFRGTMIHPQHWPEGLDYAGKRVVVIGSGATAVTLVPELAKTAAHVTMLQRSPTYIVARPSEDAFATKLNRRLPARLAYAITRWRNVAIGMLQYQVARRRPAVVKQAIIRLAQRALGPDYDVATHFTPTYNPWDQRVCLVPDGDLFRSIKAGTSSVVTGQIECFTATGIRLVSGEELAADIVVTATGLRMRLLGGMALVVDGVQQQLGQLLIYRGMMYGGVPNFANVFGYTNASWTLKADLSCAYVCRLLNIMARRGYVSCTPQVDPAMTADATVNFTSGYIQRALADLPKQGSKAPWKLYQNYALDLLSLRFGRVKDGVLQFTRKPSPRPAPAAAAAPLPGRG
jgi:cation diffusion facilitator CzcD-associated flavoprotein CzcO